MTAGDYSRYLEHKGRVGVRVPNRELADWFRDVCKFEELGIVESGFSFPVHKARSWIYLELTPSAYQELLRSVPTPLAPE